MKKAEAKKKLAELQEKQTVDSMYSNLNRARSVTVGTAFGGTVEIGMRNDTATLYAIYQPVEAIELIHQLAASVGCHINLVPRKDFSSWREWREDNGPLLGYYPNQPPFLETKLENYQMAANLPPPETQAGLNINRSNENVVATKKTVNGRSTKRAAKAS
jgi:hypothetical protein